MSLDLQPGPGAGRRVIVADDDRVQRELLRLRLEGIGFEVDAVEDGVAALERAREALPVAIVSDVLMPGLDGFELCRAVREDPELAALPVVLASSAYVEEEDRNLARDEGANAFVTRTPRMDEIVRALLDALESLPQNPGTLDEAEFETRRRARVDVQLNRHAQTQRTLKIDLSQAMRELDDAREEVVTRLALAVEFRDAGTARHTERMSRYAELLALATGIEPERARLIRTATVMHDVGKIGVPDAILLKPGPLTAEEFEQVKRHTTIGHSILAGSDSELIELAATIALTHHERWDGSGYPRGLAGERIPIEGRIAAIADVFDALTSTRVYRPAFSVEEAVAEMRKGRGSHFDSELLDAFLAHLNQVREISRSWADSDPGSRQAV